MIAEHGVSIEFFDDDNYEKLIVCTPDVEHYVKYIRSVLVDSLKVGVDAESVLVSIDMLKELYKFIKN